MSSKPTRIERLHPAGVAVIEGYMQLRLGGKLVTAPYFMNTPGRKGRRAAVGKGTAAALERETIRLARKQHFDLDGATSGQIRDFMIAHQLGIDCSGLVSWIAHALARQQMNRSLWRSITYRGHPLRRFAVKRLRPVENLSARLLTDVVNAQTIYNLREVRPGDLIRSLNGNHVLLITEVASDNLGTPLHFAYVNSTEYGGVKYGVRYGKIDVIKPNGHIIEQTWIDGENGVNWVFKAAVDFPGDTRVVRLRVLG